MSDAKKMREAMDRSVGNSRRHQGPVRARVIEHRRSGGENVVTVEVIKANGKRNAAWPELIDLEVPTFFWLGAASGTYGRIAAGAVVRVAFYEFDRNQPYLDSVIGGGPYADGSAFEVAILTPGASITLTKGGAVITAGAVTLAGGSVSVASAKSKDGGGGDSKIGGDGPTEITGETVEVKGETIVLGEGGAFVPVDGPTLIDLIAGAKYGGKTMDEAPAFKAAATAALSTKVKVA